MNCLKCKSWAAKWVGPHTTNIFICLTCSNVFATMQENHKTIAMPAGEALDATEPPENSKLQAILAWLDEYHMAFKDAKRWRREFEKFLTNLLNHKQ